MSLKKPNGSRKDPLKTPKVWQKARREKMKIYFDELQAVLPFYDPSAPMSRFEILEKSKSYIKDLQEQNQDLLNGGFDEVYKIKMTKLKQRVKELLKRVDQLTDLLRTANIMIPPLETYPEGMKAPSTFKWMNQRPKKWTEKINLIVPDDKIKSVLTLIKDYKKNSGNQNVKKKSNENSINNGGVEKKKKLLKKTNKVTNTKAAKPITGNNNSKSSNEKNDGFNESQSPGQFKENQPVDFNSLSNTTQNISKSSNVNPNNTVPVDSSKNMTDTTVSQPIVSVVTSNPSVSVTKTTIPQTAIEKPSNVILSSPPNLLQSNTFILTNDGSLVQLPLINSPGTVINPSSNLLTSIMKPSTGLVTPLLINKPSPVILLQKPPQIIQTAQIISSAPQIINVSQPSIQILGGPIVCTSTSPTVVGTKTLPHILSKAPANKKRIARDSTVTTYVNKIPIPALSKQSYSKKVVAVSSGNNKEKGTNTNTKAKDTLEKSTEKEIVANNDKEKSQEPQVEKVSNQTQSDPPEEVSEKEKEDTVVKSVAEKSQKRNSEEEKLSVRKKQKVDEATITSLQSNVFKPIENEGDGLFCNLGLPNSINPSLSVSPTAAFLSSFPIVAPARSEADDELPERKEDEDKEAKNKKEGQTSTVDKNNIEKEKSCLSKSKEESKASQIPENTVKEKVTEKQKKHIKPNPTPHTSTSVTESINSTPAAVNNSNSAEQLLSCKSWTQFPQENCDIRTDSFYVHPDNNLQINNSSGNAVETTVAPEINFSGLTNMNISTFNNFPQNPTKDHLNVQNTISDQVPLKINQFDCSQKENYMNKIPNYNNVKKVFHGTTESYPVNKNQTNNYQMDSGPDYQLIPAKDPNQRNARTVNWMTEPDVRNRGLVYGSQTQNEKMGIGKPPTYSESDHFYMTNQNPKIPTDCSGSFVMNDQNKINYQKNDYYMKDQRCKNVEKRSDSKCYNKTHQNTYNIFDYNYSGSYYGEEDSNKYCNLQTYPGKSKKNVNQSKKKEEVVQVNEQQTNTSTKRLQDQIITNLDFNPGAGQDCFTWVPGKNVEWLPSKSFGLESNLVVPSTLPTLVGDLALGTTSTNDNIQNKIANTKMCQPGLKPSDILEIGMSGNTAVPKPMDTIDSGKQYLEPFTNLSKNIFDVTPSINNHVSKNQFDKFSFPTNSNASSETIVIKNIFELPASKCSNTEFPRNKQRTVNTSQNSFLSVSQLVEPPSFDANLKNDTHMESKDPYSQNYPSYGNNSQKVYKNKVRSSHCKYKYQGYKNGSSSYTAEALIRSNTNGNYHPNEFSSDTNSNFFNGKTNQKVDQYPNNKVDFEIGMKTDFSGNPNQNIYSEFNFSSPVPNFTIPPSVGTDFGNHDPNFSQNNSFFSDFIASEYPLSDNVSNSLLLPPCSIGLQNPFAIDKRNVPLEKNKNNSKQYSRNRKYDCSKTNYNDFSISSSGAIFTSSALSCPPIFTTSTCQNLLPVPTQSIPINFSSPSFTSGNISFPPLTSNTNANYHKFPNSSQTPTSFLPSNSMFTTCTTKPLPTSQNCPSSNPLTSVTNSVISSFPVGNVPFSASSQSNIPFFSLSNPIIPSSVPTSSGNSLANFNLSTIFPEINQKGNYHYS